mgnify:CR=1 FL=1
MLHSLAAQVDYFQNLIRQHPGWEFCGVFADEAKTGTKDERPEYQKMLEKCRNREVDLVITKSISRFARNTVTLLETVRELKSLGIDVWFEKENLHSTSGDGELMLSILASFAQEESKSGFTKEEAAALAARMREFPHVALKGLMAIPPVSEFPGENCRYFAEMRNLFVDIKAKKYDNVSMECLSMGMSDDFTDAIAEGSTMVRIGTAIFGKRNYNI